MALSEKEGRNEGHYMALSERKEGRKVLTWHCLRRKEGPYMTLSEKEGRKEGPYMALSEKEGRKEERKKGPYMALSEKEGRKVLTCHCLRGNSSWLLIHIVIRCTEP
jgi:hypothetical protein